MEHRRVGREPPAPSVELPSRRRMVPPILIEVRAVGLVVNHHRLQLDRCQMWWTQPRPQQARCSLARTLSCPLARSLAYPLASPTALFLVSALVLVLPLAQVSPLVSLDTAHNVSI